MWCKSIPFHGNRQGNLRQQPKVDHRNLPSIYLKSSSTVWCIVVLFLHFISVRPGIKDACCSLAWNISLLEAFPESMQAISLNCFHSGCNVCICGCVSRWVDCGRRTGLSTNRWRRGINQGCVCHTETTRTPVAWSYSIFSRLSTYFAPASGFHNT